MTGWFVNWVVDLIVGGVVNLFDGLIGRVVKEWSTRLLMR